MCLRTPDTVGAACGCALCDTQGPQDGSAGIPKSMQMYTLLYQ